MPAGADGWATAIGRGVTTHPPKIMAIGTTHKKLVFTALPRTNMSSKVAPANCASDSECSWPPGFRLVCWRPPVGVEAFFLWSAERNYLALRLPDVKEAPAFLTPLDRKARFERCITLGVPIFFTNL